MTPNTPAGSSISSSVEPPRLCAGIAGVGGRLRAEPADFFVDEVPQYACSGEGQHLYLHIEKTERTTDEVEDWLRARGFAEVGVAGKKDKRAVTRQWFSVERRLWNDGHAAALPAGVRLLAAAAHGNKLKTGHLRGNKFRIRIRDPRRDEAAVARIAARIAELGLPNAFGEQRFGRAGDNAAQGLRVLEGRLRTSKKKAQFLLSALQSELFNRVLARRIEDGSWRRVLEGDVLKKTATGGLFVSSDPAVDQPRLDAREVVPTGPLFGPAMPPPAGAALALESGVLAASGIAPETFANTRAPTTGTRRALIVYPESLEASWEPDGSLVLAFFLPKGSYATTLLREFMGDRATDDDAAGDDSVSL